MDNNKRSHSPDQYGHWGSFSGSSKKAYNDNTEKQDDDNKSFNFYFTQTASNVGCQPSTVEKRVYPGNDPAFWTSGNLHPIGTSVVLKLHHETVYIRANRIVFRYPFKELDILVAAMEQSILKISKDENGRDGYEGLSAPQTFEEIMSPGFWDSPNCIKAYYLRFCPYIPSHRYATESLAFRMMQEVQDKHKIFKQDKLVWEGPSTFVSVDSFKEMAIVLRDFMTGTYRSISKSSIEAN